MSQRVFYGGEAMPSHTKRYLGPRQRISQCAALWIVLSVSLPLLPYRPMTVKAGGRATSSSSVTTRPTQQPDSPHGAGKDTQAISVSELGEPMELLLSAGQIVAQSIPAWQATHANVGQTSAPQGDKDVRPLEPGKPIEQKLAGGQSHSYRVKLTGGQYLHLVVDQRGIDVEVSLFAPDGKQEAEVNLTGPGGLEALS